MTLSKETIEVLMELYDDALSDLHVFRNTDSEISVRKIQGCHEIINKIWRLLDEKGYEIKREVVKS